MSESKARTARKTKPSLRDQLARKRAKVVTEYFALDDEGEKALRRVTELENLLTTMRRIKSANPKSDVDLPTLEADLAAAEAARVEHCIALRFRGLTEDERDALASEYATDDVPDDADEAERRVVEAKNLEKLKEWTYHAMAACVLDSDLTAEEWRDELSSDRWTAGDMLTIRSAITEAYGAQPADGIPKG